MSLFPLPSYERLLGEKAVCFEMGVIVCRTLALKAAAPFDPASLAPIADKDADDVELNLRGMLFGMAQGVRMLEASNYLDLAEVEDFDIIDYNTENGFHTLALLEALTMSGHLSKARSVTLMHPSPRALERARHGMSRMVSGVHHQIIRQSLPTAHAGITQSIRYHSSTILHILPDCLDVPGIDLTLLNQLVNVPDKTNIVICLGAIRSTDWAASRLMRLSPKTSVIAEVESPLLCYPSGNEAVSLRLLIYSTSPAEQPRAPQKRVRVQGDMPEVRSDILWKTRLRNLHMPHELFTFIDDIERHLRPDDNIFLNPRLGPFQADILVTRPNRGLLLCNTLRLPPSHPHFEKKAIDMANDLREMRKLLAMSLPGVDGRRIVRDTIHLAIVCTAAPTAHLPRLILPGETFLLSPDALHTEQGTHLFMSYVPYKGNKHFCEKNANIANSLLVSQWHWHRSLFTLNGNQKHAAHPDGPLSIAGGASTGKSTALSRRAASLAALCHTRVLVVVPRASALHHMRRSVQQSGCYFATGSIDVVAISDLARYSQSPAIDTTITTSTYSHAAEEAAQYFHSRPDRLPPYPYILIDDAQDINPAYLRLLRLRYASSRSQIVYFFNPLLGDVSHIPEAELTLQPPLTAFQEKSAPLIHRISRHINPLIPEIEYEPTPMPVKNYTTTYTTPADLAMQIHKIIATEEMRSGDTVIVSTDVWLLRELHQFLTQELEYDTIISLTTSSQIDHYKATTRNPAGAISLTDESMRHRFDLTGERLAFATPADISGLHATHIIYLYCPTTSPDYKTIYKVITRPTLTLTIITISNKA